MVKEFFDDDANFIRLEAEVKSWKGTRHAHRDVCIKGSFTNCARWADATLAAVNAIPHVKFPRYVTRNGGRAMLKVLTDTLDGAERLERVWINDGQTQPPLPHRGRLIVISSGTIIHHLAIILQPPTIWHCLERVEEANYFDSNVRNHLYAVYRAVIHE